MTHQSNLASAALAGTPIGEHLKGLWNGPDHLP